MSVRFRCDRWEDRLGRLTVALTRLFAAKTSLSRLVDEAVNGEDIVIAKAGKPMVRLVPIVRGSRRTGFGADRGRIRVRKDFDAPLPRSVLRAFGVKP